jgi:hypothetical protein
MTRWSVGTLVATLVVSPWSGCDREPVSPPASPPSERAPVDAVEQADPSSLGGIILLDPAGRRG